MKKNGIPELKFVKWKEFQRLCFELSIKLKSEKYDTMVSISRGGHVISRILSDFLNLPIYNVSIQSYDGINQRKELVMNQKLGRYLESHSVLLVDEIVDTGESLKKAVSYLKRVRISKLSTVCLHVKPHSSFFPDFYVRETDKWVVYPYEVRETIEGLWVFWEKARVSKAKRIQTLIDGGMSKPQVEAMYEEVEKAKN